MIVYIINNLFTTCKVNKKSAHVVLIVHKKYVKNT